MALLAAVPVAAQDDNRPKNLAIMSAPPELAAPSAFGPFPQQLWIDGFAFHGKDVVGQTDLSYASNYYVTNPGSASPQRYYARLGLNSGAVINSVDCYVNDAGANDVFVSLQRSIHHDTNPVGFTTTTHGSATSTGTSWFQTLSFNSTLLVENATGNNYKLYFLTADIASNTSIRSCRVTWTQTVSPAPGTQTFTDVPTTHPFHRFVEALAASGITGGCGGGNYCPDSPLTRGQMAVFLAAALGLHFPQ
jgi:S-layer family protein